MINLTSKSQHDTLVAQKGASALIVIDFHATWCGPCHAIAPTYAGFEASHPSVTFTKCDVDACRDVAQHYQISAMPTFIFLKGGKVVETVKGANKSALTTALNRHSSGSTNTGAAGAAGAPGTHGWGTGQRLGDGTPQNPSAAVAAPWRFPKSVGDVKGLWGGLSGGQKMGLGLVVAYAGLVWFMR